MLTEMMVKKMESRKNLINFRARLWVSNSQRACFCDSFSRRAWEWIDLLSLNSSFERVHWNHENIFFHFIFPYPLFLLMHETASSSVDSRRFHDVMSARRLLNCRRRLGEATFRHRQISWHWVKLHSFFAVNFSLINNWHRSVDQYHQNVEIT